MNREMERAKELLAAAGFRISIGSCGCCSSPWVKIEHNGELILKADSADMDMFEDAEK